MNALLLASRCLLGVVFFVAALGKLLDQPGARQALEEFGITRRLVPVAAIGLPSLELVTAVLLVIRLTALAGAVAALLLLGSFVAGILRALSQGRAPDCHCFGQLHSEPAGPATLVRNIAFAALALLIIIGGVGPSINGALKGLDTAQVALVCTSVVAAVLGFAVIQLWGVRRGLQAENHALRNAGRPSGLAPGTVAPGFELESVRGTAESLDGLARADVPTVLVFVSTSCAPCLELLAHVGNWQQALGESITLCAIFSGPRAEIERLAEAHELTDALAQRQEEAFRSYALTATPSAVIINPDGTIAAPPAEGAPAIEALIRSVLPVSSEFVIHHG